MSGEQLTALLEIPISLAQGTPAKKTLRTWKAMVASRSKASQQ